MDDTVQMFGKEYPYVIMAIKVNPSTFESLGEPVFFGSKSTYKLNNSDNDPTNTTIIGSDIVTYGDDDGDDSTFLLIARDRDIDDKSSTGIKRFIMTTTLKYIPSDNTLTIDRATMWKYEYELFNTDNNKPQLNELYDKVIESINTTHEYQRNIVVDAKNSLKAKLQLGNPEHSEAEEEEEEEKTTIKKGHTITDLEANLPYFKKSAYNVLMSPFWFKLCSLSPKVLNGEDGKSGVKAKILTSNDGNSTIDNIILKPLIKGCYVQINSLYATPLVLSALADFFKEDDIYRYCDRLHNDNDIYMNLVNNSENNDENDSDSDSDSDSNKQSVKSPFLFVHIFQFINLVERVVTSQLKRNDLQNIKSTDDNFYIINFIHESLAAIQYHSQYLNALKDINVHTYNVTMDNRGSMQLPKFIDVVVNSTSRNDIIVYLKINNTNQVNDKTREYINKRYNIQLNQIVNQSSNTQKHTVMQIDYNNDPISYYNPEKKQNNIPYVNPLLLDANTEVVQKYSSKIQLREGSTDGNREIESINTYDYHYTFGNFEKIFLPSQTNKAVAEQMDAILDQMCNQNKPVFLMGYGTSGSGKTSSLVYFNSENQEERLGVVMYLCDMAWNDKKYNNWQSKKQNKNAPNILECAAVGVNHGVRSAGSAARCRGHAPLMVRPAAHAMLSKS